MDVTASSAQTKPACISFQISCKVTSSELDYCANSRQQEYDETIRYYGQNARSNRCISTTARSHAIRIFENLDAWLDLNEIDPYPINPGLLFIEVCEFQKVVLTLCPLFNYSVDEQRENEIVIHRDSDNRKVRFSFPAVTRASDTTVQSTC